MVHIYILGLAWCSLLAHTEGEKYCVRPRNKATAIHYVYVHTVQLEACYPVEFQTSLFMYRNARNVSLVPRPRPTLSLAVRFFVRARGELKNEAIEMYAGIKIVLLCILKNMQFIILSEVIAKQHRIEISVT